MALEPGQRAAVGQGRVGVVDHLARAVGHVHRGDGHEQGRREQDAGHDADHGDPERARASNPCWQSGKTPSGAPDLATLDSRFGALRNVDGDPHHLEGIPGDSQALQRARQGPFFCPETRRRELRWHANSPREDPEHRDHGAHRRRQDDDDRAHPVLHGPNPQDGRGPRGRGRHGLDGAGAGARDHHHVRRDHRLLARPPGQHHRHAGPRGLHRRGGALAARARRRGGRVRLRRRRRAAVRDRLAPGRQVPRPAHRLHQQDGPHRRRLRRLRAVDESTAWAPTPSTIQLPIGAEGDFRGVIDLVTNKAIVYQDDLGQEWGEEEIPAEMADAGPRGPHQADRGRRRLRRRADGGLPRGQADRGRPPARGHPQGDPRHLHHPGPVRLGLQEQGRPAPARRGHRLPAQPAGRPAGRGPRGLPDPGRRGHADHPRARRRRPLQRAGLQGHVRPVRRQAHLLPRLLRQALRGRPRAQHDHRPHRARRAAS